jgi:hypothetical protein
VRPFFVLHDSPKERLLIEVSYGGKSTQWCRSLWRTAYYFEINWEQCGVEELFPPRSLSARFVEAMA